LADVVAAGLSAGFAAAVPSVALAAPGLSSAAAVPIVNAATRHGIIQRNIILLRINEGEAMPLYAGMTVNERLVISGQIAAWDAAVVSGDRARMIEILMATELTAEQAAYTADTTLANPEKYGFPPAKG
jgi:hypothetical protein